jgi:hypothetical protein
MKKRSIQSWEAALSTLFTPEFPQPYFPTYEDSTDKDQSYNFPSEYLYHNEVTLTFRQFPGHGNVSP